VIDAGEGMGGAYGTIREISAVSGTVHTIAGGYNAQRRSGSDPVGHQFGYLWHGAVDANGNVYVADDGTSKVWEITTGGKLVLVADLSDPRRVTNAEGVAVDSEENVFMLGSGVVWEKRAPSATAPKLTIAPLAGVQHLLSSHAVTVDVNCDKACSLAGTGTVTVAGRSFPLGRAARGLGMFGGCVAHLTLSPPASTLAAIRKSVKPGTALPVTVKVAASDGSGHTTTGSRAATVTP
jgi:hypothetical protein